MPTSSSVAASLKKGEGEPLTRYDIQYCLLEKIFSDTRAVFTQRHKHKPDSKTTFGNLYRSDFMASTKLSKSLKDKFLGDATVARKVCMASVVINTGRINTTLVFTPTQARTYNPIPSIQAYGAGHKLLQDAPRLKAILKGACEKSPQDWETLRAAQLADAPRPLVNPIQLIFLLTSPNTKLDVQHFPDPYYLPHEVLSDVHYTSDSRARAWLWLMYHYMETDGSVEAAANNPFGPSPEGVLVPPLEEGSEEESRLENTDSQVEQEYSAKMWEERKRYLATAAQRATEIQTPARDGVEGTPGDPSQPKGTDPHLDEFGQPTTRRSSRKIKKRVYDSGPDSAEEALLLETPAASKSTNEAIEVSEDYKSLRSAQIIRHTLARSRNASWKRRRLGVATQQDDDNNDEGDAEGGDGLESAIAREFRISLLNASYPTHIPRQRHRRSSVGNDEEHRTVKSEDDAEDEGRVGGVDDDGWLWDDSDGEVAYHYAKLIRRAERRAKHRAATNGHGHGHGHGHGVSHGEKIANGKGGGSGPGGASGHTKKTSSVVASSVLGGNHGSGGTGSGDGNNGTHGGVGAGTSGTGAMGREKRRQSAERPGPAGFKIKLRF